MRLPIINTALFVLSALGIAGVSAQAPPNRVVDPTVFPKIKPSNKLEWTDCYEVFKCARLSVPGKLRGRPSKDRIQIAIIRLPYKRVNESMPAESLGTIHVQLGGWSASSTVELPSPFGESFTPLFAGYELLAIDYRGYGWSPPSINCFTSEQERQTYALSEPPLLGSSANSADVWDARGKDFSSRCATNAANAVKYAGSYAAAADHVAVMKAMGQHKINFWAVTSGAVVASTVAYKWPQHVGKILLDAPAPASLSYTSTTAQAYAIQDADKALTAFLYICLKADPKGPTPCNFTGASTTLADIRGRFDKIEADLKRRTDGGIAVQGFERRFDWSVFKYVESLPLFVPALFPVLAGVLSELESGQYAGFVPFALANFTYQPVPPLPMLTEDPTFDGLLAGACIDATKPPRTRAQFDAYYADLEQRVPSVAPLFAGAPLTCKSWGVRTVNRCCGPYAADIGKHGGKVVILNNVADPASSVENARRIRDSFKGAAAVVESVVAGHTSFVATSDCLNKVIFEFFATGTVPKDGLRCEGAHAQAFGVPLPGDFRKGGLLCGACRVLPASVSCCCTE
ncbi:hypothetical protein Micbo1qcDRAFT_181126 [Microdochium bolleyi]|uniref:Alpha/Beta hydrolase protein n=1 Tax=Microdochium bolleyi TaxID=196109 RepID=A0A136IJB3_9PEZI|nr:hypothetical protein Micbo1qcDRAFT_181126 [Microdochium bolleyi]